jgi:hypothetical protein
MFRRIQRPIIQLQVVDPQLAEIGIAHIGSPVRQHRSGERQDYWVTFTAELWAGTSPGFRSAHPEERLLARIIHERHQLVRISVETLGFCRADGVNPVGVG